MVLPYTTEIALTAVPKNISAGLTMADNATYLIQCRGAGIFKFSDQADADTPTMRAPNITHAIGDKLFYTKVEGTSLWAWSTAANADTGLSVVLSLG